MTNLVNLERDMFWSSNEVSITAALANMAPSEISCGSTGIVGNRINFAKLTGSIAVTGASNNYTIFGCAMLQPLQDNVPYRVKGAAVSGTSQFVWGYGFASALVAGVSPVQRKVIFAAGQTCDEIVCIPPLDDTDPNFGDPLMFFCGISNPTVDNFRIGTISVQRLLSKPPQFASAVS